MELERNYIASPMSETPATDDDVEAQKKDDDADADDADADDSSSVPTSPPCKIGALPGTRTLYEECRFGLAAAFLMFCVPDMRKLGRQERLKGDPGQIQRLIDCPFSYEDLIQIFHDNRQLLIDESIKDVKRAQYYADVLASTWQIEAWGEEVYKEHKRASKIVVFHDHRQEQEIVYAITCDTLLKKIHVIFRGSVTPKDFKQDAKGFLSTIPNPVDLDYPGRVDELGIHLGFREYLYSEENLLKVAHRPRAYKQVMDRVDKALEKNKGSAPNGRSEESEQMATLRSEFRKKSNGTKTNVPMKYEVILEEVLDLLEDNPDYRLYVSGFSLGGALSTLFSFEAACDKRIPSPITCITSGPPKAGNIELMLAYEALERAGRLRCVQLCNDQDPITGMPPNGTINLCHAIFCQSRRFRHVGLQIELRHTGLVIRHPPTIRGYIGILYFDCRQITRFWFYFSISVLAALLCYAGSVFVAIPVTVCCVYRQAKKFRRHHSQLAYIDRLEYCRPDLDQLFLDELNKMRWDRPTLHFPILHKYRSANWRCGRRTDQAS